MKKLIIVCDEKTKIYGNYLTQLISSDDDTEDEVIGVKDGEVAATVWTEKQYLDNSVQMASTQHVIFIGNNKTTKEKRANMKEIFNKYGMKICTLGKQAVLYVDGVVKKEEYDSFIEYAKENNLNLEKKIKLKKEVPLKELEENNNNDKKIENILFSAKKIANKVTNTVTNISIESMNNFNKLSNNAGIEQQEYNCLVMEFYLRGLSNFLGLYEE